MKHKHHIIPKHMNGTDDKDNIVYLTIEEHAEAHKKLYEQHGCWQDKLAWQGLAGLMTHEECVREKLSRAGKKGAELTNKKLGTGPGSRKHLEQYKHMPGGKRNTFGAPNGNKNGNKKYKIITPDNDIIEINGLSQWCRKMNLNMKSFHKIVIGRKRRYKGYKLYK